MAGRALSISVVAILAAVPALAAEGRVDNHDPRGDVSYGGQSVSPKADRPDLDIRRVRLDHRHERLLRWTVRTSAPLARLRQRLQLTIDSRGGKRQCQFGARGRRLERTVFRDGKFEHSVRRVRFRRVGKRSYRWTIKRRQLFDRRRMSFQAVARDPADTRAFDNGSFVVYEEAIDFAPDGDRENPEQRVTP